jgi:peptidoglycan/LPS O-acetylase OafA/YrhL
MLIIFILLEFVKLLAFNFTGLSFNNQPFTNDNALTEFIPNLFLIHSWTPFTEPLSFNSPSWSISIEFYIYALLFFTIALFKDFKTLIWFFISTLAFYLIYSGSAILVDNVLRGLSCFFGGASVYFIYTKLGHFKPSYFLSSLVELSLLAVIFAVVSSNFELKSLIIKPLFFLTVLFFAYEAGIISKILKINLFQTTGKLSYSIYMTHAAVLFCLNSLGLVVQKLTGKLIAPMVNSQRYLDFGSEWINNLLVIITVAIIIYISKFTYTYVELKGLELNKNKLFGNSHENNRNQI